MSEPNGGAAESGWVAVRATDDEAEAEMVAGLLRSHGIEAKVLSKRFRQEPVNFGLLGSVQIMVLSSAQSEAEAILESPSEEVFELSSDDGSDPEEE